jgi:hypothetical protein
VKRCCVLLSLVLLSALVCADDPGPPPTARERADLFHRDRDLIQALVDHGLLLAEETDPLKRAESCTDLAEQLDREMQQAEGKDGPRAAELSLHLRDLLKGGVEPTLNFASGQIPKGSTDRKKLDEVSERAKKLQERLRLNAVSSQDGTSFKVNAAARPDPDPTADKEPSKP